MSKRTQPSVVLTWAEGAQLSSPVFIPGRAFSRVVLSAGFEGATIAVRAAPGDSDDTPLEADYLPVVDAAGEALTLPVAEGSAVAVLPDVLDGIGWMRFRAASAQAAARTATLLFPVR